MSTVDAGGAKQPDPSGGPPTAGELMKQIALKEAEKDSAALGERTAAEAEKQAVLDKQSKPSGVSDEERLARASAIIKRAADNGSPALAFAKPLAAIARMPRRNAPCRRPGALRGGNPVRNC